MGGRARQSKLRREFIHYVNDEAHAMDKEKPFDQNYFVLAKIDVSRTHVLLHASIIIICWFAEEVPPQQVAKVLLGPGFSTITQVLNVPPLLAYITSLASTPDVCTSAASRWA